MKGSKHRQTGELVEDRMSARPDDAWEASGTNVSDRSSTLWRRGESPICDVAECTTRLSRYNRGTRCWRHTDRTFPDPRFMR
jgi:hypothetical protein